MRRITYRNGRMVQGWDYPTHVVAAGTNYKYVGVEALESLKRLITPEYADRVISRNGDGFAFSLLSTCNRVEIYAATRHPEEVMGKLIELLIASGESRNNRFYTFVDQGAVKHLLTVACGLDSLAVGEPEILLQVRHASINASEPSARTVLEHLFRYAYLAGRKIRGSIGLPPNTSIGSLVAKLLESKPSHGRRILLIGAGKIARSVIKALNGGGSRNILIATRTPEKMLHSPLRNSKIYPLDEVPMLLNEVDAVIVATSAPSYIISRDMIASTRRGERLLIVDISMPRNVDPLVGSLPQVELYNIYDLASYSIPVLTQEQLRRAEELIERDAKRFTEWLASLRANSYLRLLRMKAEKIREEELSEALRRLSGDKNRDAEVVTILSRRIINRLLHEPSSRLKELAKNGEAESYGKVLMELFGIDGRDDPLRN